MCGLSDYAEQTKFIAKLVTVHRILKLSLNEVKKSQVSWSPFFEPKHLLGPRMTAGHRATFSCYSWRVEFPVRTEEDNDSSL